MLRREESRHDFAFIAGVIVGAAAGAIATLALAPAPGNDTREKVMQRVSTLDVETVKTSAATLTTSVQDAALRGKERVTEMAAKRGQPPADEAPSDEAASAPAAGGVDAVVVEETVAEVTAPATDEQKPGPS